MSSSLNSLCEGRQDEVYLHELRLFLEETFCSLLRSHHVIQGGVDPKDVRIDQEYFLGIPNAFADIRVEVKGIPPYFIEVDYGYSPERAVASLIHKYKQGARLGEAPKVVVVVDATLAATWRDIESRIRSGLTPGLNLEVWDETALLGMLRDWFGLEAETICEEKIQSLRSAVDNAEGRHAFGEAWTNDGLQSSLIWHYGFWKLRQLRDRDGLTPRTMLPPGMYPGVVTVIADLCGFSGYVKETPESDIIRSSLTTFYSKARHSILSTGGMMYEFVGDQVIGLFGIPDRPEGYVESAFDCAKMLVQVGNSVSHRWQREIDRVQKVSGVHIGISMGPMQIVSLRPFSRSNVSGIGDAINVAARLLDRAGPSQVVASNAYYQALAPEYQVAFRETAPVEAKNVGTIQAWKADFSNGTTAGRQLDAMGYS